MNAWVGKARAASRVDDSIPEPSSPSQRVAEKKGAAVRSASILGHRFWFVSCSPAGMRRRRRRNASVARETTCTSRARSWAASQGSTAVASMLQVRQVSHVHAILLTGGLLGSLGASECHSFDSSVHAYCIPRRATLAIGRLLRA